VAGITVPPDRGHPTLFSRVRSHRHHGLIVGRRLVPGCHCDPLPGLDGLDRSQPALRHLDSNREVLMRRLRRDELVSELRFRASSKPAPEPLDYRTPVSCFWSSTCVSI
jgi:hypothetical protein